jgi:predicted Zn-dependent protease
VADLYGRADKPEWAGTERARVPPAPATCPPAAPDCEFLAGRFLAAIEAAGGREDARSLYWRTRAYNALATAAFTTLETLPPSVQVHLVRAAVDRDQGRPLEAIPELKKALALRPGDAGIEQELAAALYETRNLDEALPLLARLAGPPATAPVDLAFFYGDALLQAQQVDKALPYLTAAAAREPGAAVIRQSLGRALLQGGDAAAALPHLEAGAKGDDPESDGAAHYQLAQAYQRLGRAADAKVALAEYRRRQQARQADTTPSAPQPSAGLTPP